MRVLLLGMTAFLVLSGAVWGSPATLGSQFADVCSAFAPLYAFYRAYADHLFSGDAVVVPPGLAEACVRFPEELARFHVDYVLQTGSATTGAAAYVTRLRIEASSFCDRFGASLGALAGSDGGNEPLLDEASGAGLFAEIRRMNDLVEATLDELLAGLGDGAARWAFAVTFSMRTLLGQPEVDRISAGLREILYGDSEGTRPAFSVPSDVVAAMERLVALCGRELSEAEVEEALRSATLIYAHFIADA